MPLILEDPGLPSQDVVSIKSSPSLNKCKFPCQIAIPNNKLAIIICPLHSKGNSKCKGREVLTGHPTPICIYSPGNKKVQGGKQQNI